MAARVLKAGGVRVDPDLVVGDGGYETPESLRARRDAEVRAAYEAGVADGRRAAESEGVAAVPRLAGAVAAAAQRTADAIADRSQRDVAEVLDVAMELATWIVGATCERDATALAARVEQVLPRLLPTASVRVRVAPAFVAPLREWAAAEGVEVAADPALRPGEAAVDAGHASADLSFAEARRRLVHALGLDGAARGDDDDEVVGG